MTEEQVSILLLGGVCISGIALIIFINWWDNKVKKNEPE